jgi:hypothetical protein
MADYCLPRGMVAFITTDSSTASRTLRLGCVLRETLGLMWSRRRCFLLAATLCDP